MPSGLERFEEVAAASGCTFATSARLRGLGQWDPGATVEENVSRYALDLERLFSIQKTASLDGVVMEAPGRFGRSIGDLAEFVGQVLQALVDRDPAQGRCLDEPIERRGWWLTFAGVELFLLTFAPCYPPTHSRWSGGIDSVFIVIQPRSAFSRRRRPGRRSLERSIRETIRRRFARLGMDYDLRLAESPIEAYQFVKPLAIGDPPVRWWLPVRDQAEAAA